MTVPPSNPISYVNNLQSMIPWVSYDFAPTSGNNAFSIPTLWIDTATNVYYLLVAKSSGVAIWVPSNIASNPAIETIDHIGPTPTGDFTIAAGTNVTISTGPSSLTINASSTVGTSNPTAFYAYLSAPTTNSTGDNTTFLIPYNTVTYNVNNAFVTGSNRFIAPFNGVYTFVSAIDLTNLGPTHTDYKVQLLVNGVTAYLMSEASAADLRPGTNTITINSGIQVQMNSNDFAQIQITVGPAAQPKVVGVNGGSATSTGFFAGVFNVPETITINWQRISTSQSLIPNFGYICVSPGGALVLPLPSVSIVGDIIEINLRGATSWQVTQAAGQQIFIGTLNTTLGAAGSLTSTAQGNSIRMVCSVANTTWDVLSEIGNITIV